MTGHDLREWLDALGWSQRQLARELSRIAGQTIHDRTVRRWVSGERAVPPFLPAALEKLERETLG